MFNSWNEIKSSSKFNVTIDFFRMGIILKRQQQKKEHFNHGFCPRRVQPHKAINSIATCAPATAVIAP